MDKSFAALVAREEGIAAQADAEPALLAAGDVLVRVRYSSVNYKDALALCGKGRILRRLPMIPGVDYAGEVVESESPDFAPGDLAVNTGAGAGEKKSGGYAEYARADSATLTSLAGRRLAARGGGGRHRRSHGGFVRVGVVRRRASQKPATRSRSAALRAASALSRSRCWRRWDAKSPPFRVRRRAIIWRALGAAEVLPREQMAADCKPLESARWAGGSRRRRRQDFGADAGRNKIQRRYRRLRAGRRRVFADDGYAVYFAQCAARRNRFGRHRARRARARVGIARAPHRRRFHRQNRAQPKSA